MSCYGNAVYRLASSILPTGSEFVSLSSLVVLVRDANKLVDYLNTNRFDGDITAKNLLLIYLTNALTIDLSPGLCNSSYCYLLEQDFRDRVGRKFSEDELSEIKFQLSFN